MRDSGDTSTQLIRRDNDWLLARLEFIWKGHFSDVPQVNEVFIGFGRKSKYRFGSIRLRLTDNSTHIRISGTFKDSDIPLEIVDHTIAHELVHYSHGFSSLLPRMHQHPHRGGIINKELKARDLEYLVTFYDWWVEEYIRELTQKSCKATFHGC
jgi:hypothetical protein